MGKSQFVWEKTVNRSQYLDDTEFKATIIKTLQHVRTNILKMNEGLKVSEKKKTYKEEPKGNFRMEKYYNQYRSLTG